jgi:hypothetical protein
MASADNEPPQDSIGQTDPINSVADNHWIIIKLAAELPRLEVNRFKCKLLCSCLDLDDERLNLGSTGSTVLESYKVGDMDEHDRAAVGAGSSGKGSAA